jgi:RNA ligase (TIGR02306 family)
MSKLIVEVCTVDKIERHPNADRMVVATVKGWKTCIRFDPESGKAEFEVGEKCIFFPPDSVLLPELANGPDESPAGRLNVRKYLSPLPAGADDVVPPGGRVRAARMRGIASFGVITKIDPALGDDPNWAVGTDLAEHFGVTKWDPPPEILGEDCLPEHILFHRYTEIENLGNFPEAIPDGVEVVFCEKLHGKNCRLGSVLVDGDDGADSDWQWMVGSHDARLKEVTAKGTRSPFWQALGDKEKALIAYIRDEMPFDGARCAVILFGELFGSGVQDMAYGLKDGEKRLRVFDISVNGNYLDYDTKRDLCAKFGVEMVPVLYRGPYSKAAVEEHTSGPTTMCEKGSIAGKFKGREGIVATPVVEQYSSGVCGRMIVKSISADYLERKGGTDSH